MDIKKHNKKTRQKGAAMTYLWQKNTNLPSPRWFLPFVFALIILFCLVSLARAEEVKWENFSDDQIVEAIGKAENSIKYPYGIKSIDTKGNKEYARHICLNSVHNGRARWIKAGNPDDLIIFIGLKFCPPQAHKLNSNWVKNVKHFLLKND